MRPPSRLRHALILAAALPGLGGCDLAAAGYFTPGLGRPMTGLVLDSETRLPVGGATVLAGLGSTVTDGEGRFRLFGNFGSDEISVSRAGYVAMTLGGVPADGSEELQFELEPLFPVRASMPTRFLELTGPVTGLPTPTSHAVVSLGGTTRPVSNGAYSVDFKGGVPGKVLTTILAWGTTDVAYVEGVAQAPPFRFNDFAYEVRHWPLGDTIPEARVQFPLAIRNQVPIKNVRVSYGNVGAFAQVQTDVQLDFGVLGYVPVARANASSQQLPVPTMEGLKYVVTGQAVDASGRAGSLVMITTNDPGKATFQLLSVPKVIAPAPGATGVGQRPTFEWTPVPGDVEYEVTLYEVGEAKPKWVARTDLPEITYPGFSPNDVNGGALRETEKGYTWTLRVIDLLEETETPSARADFAAGGLAGLGFGVSGPVPVRPYRSRKREAEVRENGFKP